MLQGKYLVMENRPTCLQSVMVRRIVQLVFVSPDPLLSPENFDWYLVW